MTPHRNLNRVHSRAPLTPQTSVRLNQSTTALTCSTFTYELHKRTRYYHVGSGPQLLATMASNRARRVTKEIADIHHDQLSKITASPAGEGQDIMHLKGSFMGPPGTAYEGGTYVIDIKIPTDYPFRPPVMRFETKVWHPNVSSQTVSRGVSRRSCSARLTFSGCHLLGHTFFCLVSSPYHQIGSPFPSVTAQHARTERPSRCRSGQHADEEPQGVPSRCVRMGYQICRCPQAGWW